MKKERTKVKGKAKITKLKKNVKGITLIALVVTIALNCQRSGRKFKRENKIKKLKKYRFSLKIYYVN